MVRLDKFKVGDKVRLSSQGHYKETALSFKSHDTKCLYVWLREDGIYTIQEIEELEGFPEAVGHTQILRLEEDPNYSGRPNWSGAYWELVSENTDGQE